MAILDRLCGKLPLILHDTSFYTTVLQVCIELVRHEQSLPTLPVLVLTDCFDMLTINQCEKLFSFVESNVSVWKEDTFFASCKTSVLRMCNGE